MPLAIVGQARKTVGMAIVDLPIEPLLGDICATKTPAVWWAACPGPGKRRAYHRDGWLVAGV